MEQHPWRRAARMREQSREQLQRSASCKELSPRRTPAGASPEKKDNGIWRTEEFPELPRPRRECLTARGRVRQPPGLTPGEWHWDEDEALKLLQGAWTNVENSRESYLVNGSQVCRINDDGTKYFGERLRWQASTEVLFWGAGRYYLKTPTGPVDKVTWVCQKGGRGFAWIRSEDATPQWDGSRLEQRRRAQSEQPSEAALRSASAGRRRAQRMPKFTGRVARKSQPELRQEVSGDEEKPQPMPDEAPDEVATEARPSARRRRSSQRQRVWQRVCWESEEQSPEVEVEHIPADEEAKPEGKQEPTEAAAEEKAEEDEDLQANAEASSSTTAPNLQASSSTTAPNLQVADTELFAKLAAAAEAVKEAASAQERKEMEEVFKAAYVAAATQARLICGPSASELDVASEVTLQMSLLQKTGAASSAQTAQQDACRSSRQSTGRVKDTKVGQLADVSVVFRDKPEAPPTSNFWDFPLSRHEKKARVLMINQRVVELDRLSLVEKIHALKEGKEIDDESSSCEED